MSTNTTNTPIGISFADTNPSKNDNIASGYPISQEWFNKNTGERFFHKMDGIWVSYTSTDSIGEAPVMFADVATTAQFDGLYNNGVDGVGATLTRSTDGILDVDGVRLNLDVVVLVKDQPAGDFEFGMPSLQYQNGVYIVTQAGTSVLPVILTRVDFADETSEIYPSQVNILDGVVNRDKFFLEKEVEPVIGVDPIVYETKEIPPTAQVVLPVVFVDTATTEPLPSCTYSNIYNPVVPGQSWYLPFPIGATLTANTNGPIGTINGVLMGNSFANRNNRILVKNQVDKKQNGDYQVVNAGSLTTPWVLQRITTSGSSMVRSSREWKVNNEASSLYGNRYNLINSTPAIKVGMANLEFSEISSIYEVLVTGLLTGGGTSSSITIGTDPTIATGSGVFGYVPYWNSAQNLSSTSSIYNVGTNVGISNFSPTHPLTIGSSASGIGGQISLQGRTSGNVVIKTSDVTSSWTASLPTTKGSITPFVYSNFGGEIMLNDGNGNLFFGTTPSLSLSENTVFIGNTYGYAKSRTLMGDIYSDYTGTITINNGVVSYQKMQTVSQPALLGSTIAGGPVTEIPYFDFFIPLGTIATNLENVSNWSAGAYIGPAITGTYQGQSHYDSSYYFMAVEDNQWIRILRA